MTTRGEWATELLHALGNNTPDARTVNFVASWTLGENTRARYNPLATTQPAAGATNFNPVGVKNYPTDQAGIDATVKTIQNGYYPHILHGLQNNDPEEAANALELGTWGTGMGFVTLWRLGDHRNEPLKSHEAGAISGGSWGTGASQEPSNEGSLPGDEQNPLTRVIGGTLDTGDQLGLGGPQNPPDIAPADVSRSISYIALGGTLLLIAALLAIRTYVPTRQIVKTIAEAA